MSVCYTSELLHYFPYNLLFRESATVSTRTGSIIMWPPGL
jgi:hypothetical protein